MIDEPIRGWRRRFASIAVMVACVLVSSETLASEPQCRREAFEAAVSDAAAALRDLAAVNRPYFHSRLQALRAKRGWSEADLQRKAAPIVQDAETDAFDQRSTELLDKIQRMGTEGASAVEPHCEAFRRLRDTMQELVETQRAKWAYLIAKVEREQAQ